MDGLSAVYYLGDDGQRYVFPNTSTYMSWYSDFSGVVTVPSTELQSYPIGGNVTMRPGTNLVKITTDPTVYAVEPGGELRSIVSEENAIDLYGADWASRVVDVPDAFFVNYEKGSALTVGEYPTGTIVQEEGSSDAYYVDNGEYRPFSGEAAFLANNFKWSDVVTTTKSITSTGSEISGFAQDLFNPAGGATTGGSTVPTGSGLSAALSAMTPAAQSIPTTVSRVPFTKVNLTAANDGDVEIDSLTVTRSGLTSLDNATVKVWVEHDGTAVSSKRNLNDDEAILTLSPAVNIDAGHTISLDILAELSGDMGGNMALGINSASAVTAGGATVSGSFPITGNIMSITDYNVTVVDFEGKGGEETTDYTYTVGDTDVELGKFEVSLYDNERDINFKSVTLRNTGIEDLSDVLMESYLEYAGEKVSEYATFDGRYAYFELSDDGLEILKNDSSKLFTLRGDLVDKTSSDDNSLDFSLQRDYHLVAEEMSTGFGVSYKDTLSDPQVSTVTIDSGVVTVSKKTSSPSNDNIAKGVNNAVNLLANIKADEDIRAEGMTLDFDTDDTTGDSFYNIRVYLNNTLLDSFGVEDIDGNNEYEIDSFLDLNAGDNEVKVTVSVRNSATDDDYFKALLQTSDNNLLSFPEYVSNGLVVSTTDITGSADGAKLTVAAASLDVTRNDGYADNRTVVQGMSDVSLGKFAISANNDDIRVTNVALGSNGGSLTDSSIYDMKLYVDGSQIGSTRNFGSSGSSFTGLDYTISQNDSKVFELKGSFDSSNTGTFQTDFKVNSQDSTGSSLGEKSDSTVIFDIVEAGEVNISIGANTPKSDILLASTGQEHNLADYRITTVDDSAEITEVKIKDLGDGSSRVNELRLYAGATLLDTAVPVNGSATTFYVNPGDLVVPANGNETISVRAEFNEINLAGQSGETFKVTLDEILAESSTGAEITKNLNIAANEMVLRKTKPTFAKISGYTGGANSEQEMLRFTVTADANDDLRLNELTFDLEGNDSGTTEITGNTLSLYEDGDTTALNTTTATADGTKTKAVFDTNEVAAVHTITISSTATSGTDVVSTVELPNFDGTYTTVTATTTGELTGTTDTDEGVIANDIHTAINSASVDWTSTNSESSNVVTITAKQVGAWGNGLGSVTIDHADISSTEENTESGVDPWGVEISAGTSKTFYVVADTSGMTTDADRFGVSLRTPSTNVAWQEYFVTGYELDTDTGSAVTISGDYLKEFPITGGLMDY